MNFLRVTQTSVRDILDRLALHYPKSTQIRVLDILAEDYARACKDMTQAEFEAAAFKALETSRYFPTVAQIREARELVKAEKLRQEIKANDEQIEEWSDEKSELAKRRAREVMEALRNGTRPSFMQ